MNKGIAMRKMMMAIPFLLSGCASLTDMLAPPYLPEPIHVYDADQFAADVLECKTAGANYKPHVSLGSALAMTVEGATSNTSLIPISPLVPVYGAAGGALGAASDGFDVMSGQHSAVYRNCLRDEVRRDRSAIVVDPRP